MAVDQRERSGAMWVYERVREDIFSGALKPGERVSQVRLAAALGVGRPTLREALRMLQNEGLVRAEHNRQMVIAPLDLGDFEQLCALRLAVEPMAIELSVPKLTDTDLAEIVTAEADGVRLQNELDYHALERAHRRLHFLLFGRAGERIRRACEDMWQSAERYRRQMIGRTDDLRAIAQIAANDHAAIVQAALAGDEKRCADYVTQHILKVNMIAVSLIDGSHEPQVLRIASNRVRSSS